MTFIDKMHNQIENGFLIKSSFGDFPKGMPLARGPC